MEYSFGREFIPARLSKTAMARMLLAIVVALLFHPAAQADALDRSSSFHIAAAPLASALIDFSAQSGIQVAAADADVAHLNSSGLNGAFPARVALATLLQGTGLGFSLVGAQTVAIAAAPVAPPTRVISNGGSAVTKTPDLKVLPPDPNAANLSPVIPDLTVTAPRPPTEAELAKDSLQDFIIHHSSVHYFNTSVKGNLARWRGGLQSICPITVGLTPDYNAFVTARVRALATYVGAPVVSNEQCESSVQITFTSDPQSVMADVVKWAEAYYAPKAEFAHRRRLIAFTPDHAIQGWYLTTRGGASVLNTPVRLLPLNLLPMWPQIVPRTGGADTNGIGTVILVVDARKIAGYGIETLADYLAMVSLSFVEAPDHCDPLPSILDVFSSACGNREKPTSMTAGDLAFLKALYYKNTGLGSSLSRSQIEDNMVRQFKQL